MRRLRNAEDDLEPAYTKVNNASPQILTRNTDLPSIAALDAGDVIECYALTRKAKLENSESVSPSSILIRKSAIGFRYKPLSASQDAAVKAPFELTLEYGPQRTGSTQSFEAMPSVNGHHRGLEYEDGDGMYVSWENHAKIYYGLYTADEEWDNAYYMAPITGAVLQKILSDYIMDYPIIHPRYQPFTVVEKQSGKAILNSSNSEDFVWNIFRKLADMYVAIDPILAPKRYGIQLIVEDVQRDVVKLDSNVVMTSNGANSQSGGTHERQQNVANVAAQFFDAFYSCVEAIKTGDYSTYDVTEIPTLAPSTSSPTVAPTVKVTEIVTEVVTQQNTGGDTTDEGVNGTAVEDTESVETNGSGEGNRFLRSMNDVVEQIQDIESELNDGDVLKPGNDDNAKEAAEQAEMAAEAAKAAAASKEKEKSIEAAELAAEAAKKAAQATSDAIAEADIDSLLSGDGGMMTDVLKACFSDPKFGITELADEDREIPLSTNAYLYVDGSHYYQLNLTAPFINVQQSIPTLPKQNMAPDGKSDVVDIGLAFAIIGGFCFGIIVMLHHIRVLNWDDRLQFKWFFHPDGSKGKKTKRGGYSNTSTRECNDDDSISIGDDLELAHRQIPNGMD